MPVLPQGDRELSHKRGRSQQFCDDLKNKDVQWQLLWEASRSHPQEMSVLASSDGHTSPTNKADQWACAFLHI